MRPYQNKEGAVHWVYKFPKFNQSSNLKHQCVHFRNNPWGCLVTFKDNCKMSQSFFLYLFGLNWPPWLFRWLEHWYMYTKPEVSRLSPCPENIFLSQFFKIVLKLPSPQSLFPIYCFTWLKSYNDCWTAVARFTINDGKTDCKHKNRLENITAPTCPSCYYEKT